MVYAIMDDIGNIIKIKKQLNHITSSSRCRGDSDSGDTSSIIAAVEIKVIQSYPNNKAGVAAIREFNKNKGKEVIRPGKNVPDNIIQGLM